MSTYGTIVTTTDTEDAVRETLQRWLDTMLGEVERQSGGRWALREIKRPVTWHYVTDYKAAAADRRLPCIAVESGPEARSYTGDGTVNAERGMNVIVIAKGQDRDKTRHTLEALVQAVVMVLEMHGDLDGHADGTVLGEIEPGGVVQAEKAKTAAGARIPIAVLVSNVGRRRGGPTEPDAAAPTPLPEESPEHPEHLTTNIRVNGDLSSSAVPAPPVHPPTPGVGTFLSSVASAADLPTAGSVDGDVRLVRDEDVLYVLDSDSWVPITSGGGAGGGGMETLLWDEDSEGYVAAATPPRAFVGPVDPESVGFTLSTADVWDPTEEVL